MSSPAPPSRRGAVGRSVVTSGRSRRGPSGLLRFRRRNRRVVVQPRSFSVWLSDAVVAVGRRLVVVGKVLAALAALVIVVELGRLVMRQIIASPRFAVGEIRVAPTAHLDADVVRGLAGVAVGDPLLVVDTDAVAARLATHPWILAAHVRRELPRTLAIAVTERRAAAAALLGDLYLVDETGKPFKRADLDEADGLVVLTGVDRARYLALPEASEAAFREALALLFEYRRAPASEATTARPVGATAAAPTDAPRRPALSEIHIDPRAGFSLFFYDGGGEVRVGRGPFAEKLARLDVILAALPSVGPTGLERSRSALGRLRTVHLDGPRPDRIPVRFQDGGEQDISAPAAPPAPAKKSTSLLNAVISAKGGSSPAKSPPARP